MSSNRFPGIYGLSTPLGSPSSFGNVRHIYFHSHQVALHCFTAASPLLLSGIIASASVPCPAPMLAEAWKWLVWIFSCAVCITEDLWASSQPPELTLCVVGLMCTYVISPGQPCISWGFCTLVSAPCACHLHVGLVFTCLSSLCPLPLHQGFCVHLFHLTCLTYLSHGLCVAP